MEEKGITAGFLRHDEEGCTILVLVLRQICPRKTLAWPLTVWQDCVKPCLEASCCVTEEGGGAILQRSGVGMCNREKELHGGF